MLPGSGTEGSEVSKLSFSIRLATVGDYEQLCSVWEIGDALHREALPHIFRSSGEPPMDRANVQALIAGPNSAIVVADAGGEIMGVMTILEKLVTATAIKVPRRCVEIDNMAVKQSAQHQGVGQALIDAAVNWARGRGVTRLELNVYEFNEAATALYRGAGFTTQNRRMTRKISN
jgi:diamine N-acetyltransferase